MRKLVLFALGFCGICVPCGYILWNSWFLLSGLLSLATAVILCFWKAKGARAAAVFLFGAAFAAAWCWGYDTLYLQAARGYGGQICSLTAEVSDYGYDTGYGMIVDGTVTLSGHPYRTRLYTDDTFEAAPGDRVSGDFFLRLTTDGGENASGYHKGNGIVFFAYAQAAVTVEHEERVPLRYFPAVLRMKLLTMLNVLFPADAVGFADALLLGDSTLLTYEEDTAFKISGIRHVIAVSGLHVSILFALVYLLCGKHRVLTALLGIPVLILFAAVAGFTPSIVRACVMQILMLLAMLLKREYDPPAALSAAVMLILLKNPLAVTSVSFQLSVGCMAGIFLFCGRVNGYLLRLLKAKKRKGLVGALCKWLCGGIAVTVSAMSLTTPLSTFYFGTVSLIGIFTNLAVLWVVSLVFYGIMAACIASLLWLPLGKCVAWVVSWPIRYVLQTAKLFSAFPLAAVYTESVYVVLWLVLCYGLFFCLLLMRRKSPLLATGCILVGLTVAVAASWIEPRMDNVRVTVIDVGQGQSILLQSDGKYYLVDCGGDTPEIAADKVAQTLLSQGIFRLDGVILTHYDIDHAGGVPCLLSRIDAERLYLPDIPDDGALKHKLLTEYENIVVSVDDLRTETGAWGKITMIPGESKNNENESSMCVLFQADNCDILITGDRGLSGEKQLLTQLVLPELELLVVGHHGAPGSATVPLLSKTRPEAAVISVGRDNNFGHPDKGVLARLEIYGCRVFRTDRNGTVIFRR